MNIKRSAAFVAFKYEYNANIQIYVPGKLPTFNLKTFWKFSKDKVYFST